MTYSFRPATRTSAIPLIGIYGESGTGKTMSSLLLARGLVGPEGKVCMIDTESGRGELYADDIPGSYMVASMGAPFSPANYIAAITAAEEVADCIVIDSVSHEWEGIGGVLDLAAAEEERSGKPGLHCWKKPKTEHLKFVMKLLQCKVPAVLCMRAKFKSRQVRENGRNAIVRDDHTSPIQAEDFIFEMTAHFETLKARLPNGRDQHFISLTKCLESLRPCFPDDGPVSIQTGEAIAQWAKTGEAPSQEELDVARQADVQKIARDVATMGTERLRQHWKSLPKSQRQMLDPIVDELKKAAADRDAEDEDDDPFSKPAEQPAQQAA